MISMGTVWDRTMAVITGRAAILASIAALLLVGPPIVQAAIEAVGGTSAAVKLAGGLVSILVFLSATLGALAITAVATDPAVDRSTALAIGGARIGPMLGVIIVLGIAAFIATLPGVLLLVFSGFDVERARAGLSQDNLDVAMFGLSMLYFLVLCVACVWLGAKLVPLLGVVVNERRGLGALRRSFALTRGSTLKLIGVLILYSIVLLVVLLAATSIVGLAVRLFVGADGAAWVAFAIAAVNAIITAIFSIIQAVFSGQFYLAAREARDHA